MELKVHHSKIQSLCLKGLVLSAIAVFAVACAGAPSFTVKNSASGGLITNGNDGDGVITNPVDPVDSCSREVPLEERFQIRPSSVRGANVVFAIDDSGSMGDNIANLSSNLNSFLTALGTNAEDNFRVILMFRMAGFRFGSNGQAITNGVNPFASQIDNEKVFYVPEGTGSRALDVGLFRAFALPSFMQDNIASLPADAAGQLQSSCSGAGKYFRPRLNSDSSSLSQVNTSCFDWSNRVSGEVASNKTGDTLSGPLSYLLPGISINVVGMTDDDLNINGSFPGNGLSVVKDMMSQVFRPLGETTPVYYHSFAGTATAPSGAVGSIERVGAKHLALSDATEGLTADIRSPSYADVLDQLRTRILFSSQLVTTSCSATASIPTQVLKDGVALSSSQYSFTVGTRELRILPSAFTDSDINATSIDILVRY